MPKATRNEKETVRHDLVSLPEGYVILRKLDYGEILRRRELGISVIPGEGKEKSEVNIHSVDVQVYEFSRSIVEHNLEDGEGNALNFKDKRAVISLDPQVAQEVENLISKLNEPPSEDSKS